LLKAPKNRLADKRGQAAAASNRGVILGERGDFAGAKAAFERAKRRGDPDAALSGRLAS